MTDIVLDHILDKESCQRDTYHWRDEIPPMVLLDELMLHQMLNTVDKHLEQLCCTRSQGAHKKTEDQHQVLLWDMLLAPGDKSIVCFLISKH